MKRCSISLILEKDHNSSYIIQNPEYSDFIQRNSTKLLSYFSSYICFISYVFCTFESLNMLASFLSQDFWLQHSFLLNSSAIFYYIIRILLLDLNLNIAGGNFSLIFQFREYSPILPSVSLVYFFFHFTHHSCNFICNYVVT